MGCGSLIVIGTVFGAVVGGAFVALWLIATLEQ